MAAILLIAELLSAAALGAGPGAAAPDLTLRLVLIQDGHVQSAFGNDPARFAATEAFQAGREAGVDIRASDHPLVIHSYQDRRLYYLFYTVVENAFGERPYLIQRIKKTVKDYARAEEAPETATTYLVEVLKTRWGAVPPDQHFGKYPLGGLRKREIIKEFEIGFGEIPDVAAGREWPFAPNTRFKLLQDYDSDRTLYDAVRYRRSLKWTLVVSLDQSGSYSIRASALKIDAPRSLPDAKSARPQTDPQSAHVTLAEGRGTGELVLGESGAADVQRTFGPPLGVERAGQAAKNYHHAGGLTFNIYNGGALNTIITRPSFGGATSRGIGHGDSRERVIEVYGRPAALTRASYLSYPGVLFHFSAEGRVTRIVIAPHRDPP